MVESLSFGFLIIMVKLIGGGGSEWATTSHYLAIFIPFNWYILLASLAEFMYIP